MKQINFLASLLCANLILNAQYSGIQFEQITWEEVQTKAKFENKYIFLDCFATWCGPCKLMDKEVYTNDSVARFFNDHFISVKVQMDQTVKDNDCVKRWYEVSSLLNKQYKIEGYPTLIFLSPNGNPVETELGFQNPIELMKTAIKALSTKEEAYISPYAQYDSLVSDFEIGVRNYSKMPYIISTGIKLNDTTVVRNVSKEYRKYLLSQSAEKLYTKENLEFISTNYRITSKSDFFNLFYLNGRLIDSIISDNGLSQRIIDAVIQEEIITPITKVRVDGWKFGLVADSGINNVAPNWKVLYKTIEKKYGVKYAKRNILKAKISWYEYYRNSNEWVKYYTEYVLNYGLNEESQSFDDINLNIAGWRVFSNISKHKYIDVAINWMSQVVKRAPQYNDSEYEAQVIDTYANLLYKDGKFTQAIQWEVKAVEICSLIKKDKNAKDYQNTVYKMKLRIPTWKAN